MTEKYDIVNDAFYIVYEGKDMSYLRTIGDNISLAMKHMGYSIEELSDKTGMIEADLRRVIEGRLALNSEDMMCIAKSLDVTLEDLENEKKPQEYANLIHCMGHFDKPESKELILDYIDFFVGIQEVKAEI